MDSRQLRYFVAVARERNFTRAAETLRIAQPPLSRAIQQLEEECGLPLFDRASRPLSLTDAGKLLFEQAVQVLDRMEEMRAMVARLREAERQRLGVGFVASTLYGYLPEVIRRYRAVRPDVELSLQEMTTIEQLAALKEGRIDVGFGRISFNDAAIERTLLRNEKLCVALPLTHPLSSRTGALGLAELAGDTLVVYPRLPRPSFADQVLALFRDRDVTPAAVQEVRELQTALGLVAAETGICIVPGSVERLRRDNVVYRPLDEPDAVSPIIMSTRRGDPSPEIDLILRLVKEMYRKERIEFGV
ncbi:LysR family transcriptional regulator [Paracraurococcus ruber]|uniref:LysR family transcriptional regulator n=1 Tax=Paracraurococcus ruber TaxID=77675 RepID=A0ABS1CRK4_9PROT|nr:LysR family transcriptional regulator [Paracraurococcus ruber]MBK1656917.1 LysR family transcriptional regulator [Paracraurococcus ruber]TDG33323.1 LysR family transcriptional regulator [Paracraurococcus ruber]